MTVIDESEESHSFLKTSKWIRVVDLECLKLIQNKRKQIGIFNDYFTHIDTHIDTDIDTDMLIKCGETYKHAAYIFVFV